MPTERRAATVNVLCSPHRPVAVFTVAKGDDVTFTDSGKAGFYLSNMPWTSSVVSGVDAPAELRTPDLFRYRGTPFYNWTDDVITVTTYAYAHDWADVSALENELRLVVNIPLTYSPATSPDDAEAVVYEESYYQIPVSRDKVLERNTCYEVRVTVNTPGATNPGEPVTLDEIEYEVVDWAEKTINVGGETEDAAYLSLNRYELELHNIEDDATSLVFASSSPVNVTVDRVWYIDKFGQEQTTTGASNISRLGVSASADSGLNGNLTIHSDLPTNNTIRYIELTVSNEDYIDRTVVIRQYPLEYITNVQGWYSYRDDFGGTTWKHPNGNPKRVSAYDYQRDYDWRTGEYEESWKYSAISYGQSMFFTSKVATEITTGVNKGKSKIEYYYFRRNTSSNLSRATIWDDGNARMYHIQITSTSDDYTLGRPRLTDEGITDPDEDNALLVSPSFMIASQLGAVFTVDDVYMAASHCREYVEVDSEGNVYDDWRLPTEAELKLIIDFQYKPNAAMDEVLAGKSYFSASGPVRNDQGSSTTGGTAIRCVRDVYGDESTGN